MNQHSLSTTFLPSVLIRNSIVFSADSAPFTASEDEGGDSRDTDSREGVTSKG